MMTILLTFNSLLSTKNSFFKDYIHALKNQWEDEDEKVTPTYIISKSKSKIANIQKSKNWGKNDPKDTQLVAFMTKIEKLEGKNTSTGKGGENCGKNYLILVLTSSQ